MPGYSLRQSDSQLYSEYHTNYPLSTPLVQQMVKKGKVFGLCLTISEPMLEDILCYVSANDLHQSRAQAEYKNALNK